MSEPLARALIAMVVVSFALTTLDSATRLLRFNIEEIVLITPEGAESFNSAPRSLVSLPT